MMSAAVLLDQSHPDATVVLERRQLIHLNCVSNKASNQCRLLFPDEIRYQT
jgi:hypothetical protein